MNWRIYFSAEGAGCGFPGNGLFGLISRPARRMLLCAVRGEGGQAERSPWGGGFEAGKLISRPVRIPRGARALHLRARRRFLAGGRTEDWERAAQGGDGWRKDGH